MNSPHGTVARSRADAQRLSQLAGQASTAVGAIARDIMRAAVERAAHNGDLVATSRVLERIAACAHELEVMSLEAAAHDG